MPLYVDGDLIGHLSVQGRILTIPISLQRTFLILHPFSFTFIRACVQCHVCVGGGVLRKQHPKS